MNRRIGAFELRPVLCLVVFLFLCAKGQAQFTPENRMPAIAFEAVSMSSDTRIGNSPFRAENRAGTEIDPADFDIGFESEVDTRLDLALGLYEITRYRFPASDNPNPVSFSHAESPFYAENSFRSESPFAFDYTKRPHRDTLYQASPGIDPKLLTFAQRNSGAFKRKKKGGMKSPAMATVCSAVVPGLGQIYNGQWYKTPVLYAGVGVLVYFTDMNLRERNVYDREIKARTDSTATIFNPALSDYSLQEILDLRNYYEHNFELCLIIAGAVYLLNLVDAAVYAHLSAFNVTPNLSMSIKPYARTNFAVRHAFPLDAGIRVCLTIK